MTNDVAALKLLFPEKLFFLTTALSQYVRDSESSFSHYFAQMLRFMSMR